MVFYHQCTIYQSTRRTFWTSWWTYTFLHVYVRTEKQNNNLTDIILACQKNYRSFLILSKGTNHDNLTECLLQTYDLTITKLFAYQYGWSKHLESKKFHQIRLQKCHQVPVDCDWNRGVAWVYIAAEGIEIETSQSVATSKKSFCSQGKTEVCY